ncbi:hypothetical protein X975_05867, partial [Stegodyphus mimosarum]
MRCCHTGFAAPYGSGFDGPRFVVSAQDFGDTAVGDLEDAGYVAGTSPTVGQLHD